MVLLVIRAHNGPDLEIDIRGSVMVIKSGSKARRRLEGRRGKDRKPGICFIAPQYGYDKEAIATLCLPGETLHDIGLKLDAALRNAKLPFETYHEPMVDFATDSPVFGEVMMDALAVEAVKDYPGAPEVKFQITAKFDLEYFLPRDLKTGEFIAIEDQVNCLEQLAWQYEKPNKSKAWLAAKRTELARRQKK